MRKFILLIIIVITILSNVSAQNYSWCIGPRAGNLSMGLDAVIALKGPSAVGLMMMYIYDGVQAVGIYKHYTYPFNYSNAAMIAGIGAHGGMWRRFTGSEFAPIYGGSLLLGIEWELRGVPLVLSLDYRPGFNLEGPVVISNDVGAAVKLAF